MAATLPTRHGCGNQAAIALRQAQGERWDTVLLLSRTFLDSRFRGNDEVGGAALRQAQGERWDTVRLLGRAFLDSRLRGNDEVAAIALRRAQGTELLVRTTRELDTVRPEPAA